MSCASTSIRCPACRSQIVDVALVAKDTLADFGLEGWLKTSGSRGIHICAHRATRWPFHGSRAALAFAREGATRAEDRDEQVVEGGASRRVPRLQPERTRPAMTSNA